MKAMKAMQQSKKAASPSPAKKKSKKAAKKAASPAPSRQSMKAMQQSKKAASPASPSMKSMKAVQAKKKSKKAASPAPASSMTLRPPTPVYNWSPDVKHWTVEMIGCSFVAGDWMNDSNPDVGRLFVFRVIDTKHPACVTLLQEGGQIVMD